MLMKAGLWALLACGVLVAGTRAETVTWGQPTAYAPGQVSTANSEVRLSISPDGRHELWGVISASKSDLDIYERVKTGATWSPPQPVAFNSEADDFDPAFAADGSGAYFFSKREGGVGGDDIWFAPLSGGHWGTAVNLGSGINTTQNEWAPTPMPHGCLMVATGGHDGKGGMDLMVFCRTGGVWARSAAVAPALDSLNTVSNEYDAAWLDERHIVFAHSDNPDEGASLWLGTLSDGRFSVEALPAAVNGESGWTLGPSVSGRERGQLYISSGRQGGPGRMDIWRVSWDVSAD